MITRCFWIAGTTPHPVSAASGPGMVSRQPGLFSLILCLSHQDAGNGHKSTNVLSLAAARIVGGTGVLWQVEHRTTTSDDRSKLSEEIACLAVREPKLTELGFARADAERQGPVS